MAFVKVFGTFLGAETRSLSQTLISAGTMVVVGFTIWIASVAIYRLYFHPLAKYPGPFWAKITSLHDFFVAYSERRAQNFGFLHEKYG
jgi:hypothetical protein